LVLSPNKEGTRPAGWVEFATPNFEELSFETLVRLLEEGQQNSSNEPINAHPQLLP